MDDIEKWSGCSYIQLKEMSQDREQWRRQTIEWSLPTVIDACRLDLAVGSRLAPLQHLCDAVVHQPAVCQALNKDGYYYYYGRLVSVSE